MKGGARQASAKAGLQAARSAQAQAPVKATRRAQPTRATQTRAPEQATWQLAGRPDPESVLQGRPGGWDAGSERPRR